MANGSDRIWEMARGFQASRVLLTAVELGIFPALADGPKTSGQTAAKIGADARATDRLMNALVVLGLLEKRGDGFNNGPLASESLVPGRPQYMGGALGHLLSLWRSWSTLTEAVRTGTCAPSRTSAPDVFFRPFIAAMHYNAENNAPAVMSQIDLSSVRRTLDVGGGSGAYSMAFCRAKPELQAVVFDRPEVVPLTRDYAAAAGLERRISTVEGDFTRDELPHDFDLAFLSQVLHSNSREENAALMKRVARALNPGGQIVIQEFVVDEGRTSPPQPVLFALNMLVGTEAGDTYTESEIRGWLDAAGFRRPRRVDVPGRGTTLLLASKP